MRYVEPWTGAFNLQTFFTQRPEALSVEAVEAIRTAILTSSFLSETQLYGGFSGTLGFSLTFKRESIHEAEGSFPAFKPFLDAALLDGCNAFILNPLVIQQGRQVGQHVDGSLGGFSPTIGCPVAVSVLYVQVPAQMAGGQLRLCRRGREIARVTPTPRTLLTFRGDLAHEVTAVVGEATSLEQARVSLVVEQYRLSDADNAKVPRFSFYSNAMDVLMREIEKLKA